MNDKKEKAVFVCAKDTLDGAYPALVMGINAVRTGMETKIFYTFLGLNILLKDGGRKAKFYPKGSMGAIPGFAAIASIIMKRKAKKANIPNLEDLIQMSILEGVKFIACHMTVEMMGFDKDSFIDGVEIWTAEKFMKYARECKVSFFV